MGVLSGALCLIQRVIHTTLQLQHVLYLADCRTIGLVFTLSKNIYRKLEKILQQKEVQSPVQSPVQCPAQSSVYNICFVKLVRTDVLQLNGNFHSMNTNTLDRPVVLTMATQ